MKTVSELLQLSASFLSQKGIERSRRIAEELLASVLSLKRIDLYVQYDRPVEPSEIDRMREAVRRCAKHEPVEYVVGVVEFLDCLLRVDSRVLIPRQETEILADLILREAPAAPLVCWDLCTGSGCLGIALKKRRPAWSVALSDISAEALAVARLNAQACGVDVEVVQGDLLAPFAGRVADLIVSNPPYISKREYLNLAPSVRDYEPELALVGGERGSEMYERLACELPSRLVSGGKVFLEIGAHQGAVVEQIFAAGPWRARAIKKDWAGHDRFFFLEKQ